MNNERQQLRIEILQVFKDNDAFAWEKYLAARLFKRHSIVFELAFEEHLKKMIQAIQDELDAEEVEKLQQQAYTTALMIAGYDMATATLIAQGCPAFLWAPKLGF
jgi:hypothetical protein